MRVLSVLLNLFWLFFIPVISHKIERRPRSPRETHVRKLSDLIRTSRPTSRLSSRVDNAAEPCGKVAALAVAQQSAGKQELVVTSALAYSCVRSIALVPQDAEDTIDSLEAMLGFQSTLELLKQKIGDVQPDPIDLMSSLESLRTKVTSGEMRLQYDFEMSLAAITASAKDSHLVWQGRLLGDVFNFARPQSMELVCLSVNGGAPKVYAKADVLQGKYNAVALIDGEDVHTILDDETTFLRTRDSHSAWNSLLGTSAYSRFLSPHDYPGPSTNLTFEDGSTYVRLTFAFLGETEPWSEIFDAGSLYEKSIVDRNPTEYPVPPSLLRRGYHQTTNASGIASQRLMSRNVPSEDKSLKPVIRDPYLGNKLAGYFVPLDGQKVAVLKIRTFVLSPKDPNGVEFLTTVSTFLHLCRSQSSPVTRLILDVRDNPGGDGETGIAVFKRLFPSTIPFAGSDFRRTPVAYTFGSGDLDDLVYEAVGEDIGSLFSPRAYVDASDRPWIDIQNFFGPFPRWNDKFTNLIRIKQINTNLYKVYPDEAVFEQGYQFAPKDILILSNGVCSSACSRIVEALTQEAPPGVRTLTLGGLPTAGPMQTVGGTRGSAVLDIQYLSSFTNFARETYTDENLPKGMPFMPPVRTRAASINLLNTYRKTNTEVPLEFVDDPSGCRIWYTPEIAVSELALMRRVYDVAFNGPEETAGWRGEECVEGSFGQVPRR